VIITPPITFEEWPMKASIFILLLTAAFTHASFAADVPRCWKSDQPGQDIEDGEFRVFIPTANHTALDVAEAFGIVSFSMASQIGAGASYNLDRVEIDLLGVTKYWQATAAFPTLDAFKDYILQSIKPLLSLPGVTIQCALVNHPQPSPIIPVH
jgi:hypothetical protein